MPSRTNKDTVVGMTESYLVELSVAASHGQDLIQEEVKSFGEQLKPYPLLFLKDFHISKSCLVWKEIGFWGGGAWGFVDIASELQLHKDV